VWSREVLAARNVRAFMMDALNTSCFLVAQFHITLNSFSSIL